MTWPHLVRFARKKQRARKFCEQSSDASRQGKYIQFAGCHRRRRRFRFRPYRTRQEPGGKGIKAFPPNPHRELSRPASDAASLPSNRYGGTVEQEMYVMAPSISGSIPSISPRASFKREAAASPSRLITEAEPLLGAGFYTRQAAVGALSKGRVASWRSLQDGIRPL